MADERFIIWLSQRAADLRFTEVIKSYVLEDSSYGEQYSFAYYSAYSNVHAFKNVPVPIIEIPVIVGIHPIWQRTPRASNQMKIGLYAIHYFLFLRTEG